nr:hypothetical protein [Pseudomonas helleri]
MNSAAHFTFAGERHPVSRQCKLGRGIRRRGIARQHVGGGRLITGTVCEGHVKRLAVGLGRAQFDCKSAVGRHSACAEHIASGIFDGGCRAWLAFACEGPAINVNG